MNFSETSTIGKILREAGVRTARKGEKADICVVNTCSGQGEEHPAEDQRDESIKRSEGGPGRGYYLNGVFHPYSEEEDN